jgi:hypothetical protein
LHAKRIEAELFFVSQSKKSGSVKPDPQGFAQKNLTKCFYQFKQVDSGLFFFGAWVTILVKASN